MTLLEDGGQTQKKKKVTSKENGKLGGRPKGRKNDATLEREVILKALHQRTLAAADILLDAQLVLARGQQYLFKIEKYYQTIVGNKGKKSKVLRAKPPKLVTDPLEIREYLENEISKEFGGDADLNDPEATYYFITTKDPDIRAIGAMFKRTFGNSIKPVALSEEDGTEIDHESQTKAEKALKAYFGRIGVGKRNPKRRAKRRS